MQVKWILFLLILCPVAYISIENDSKKIVDYKNKPNKTDSVFRKYGQYISQNNEHLATVKMLKNGDVEFSIDPESVGNLPKIAGFIPKSKDWFLYWDLNNNLWVYGDHFNYGLRIYKLKNNGDFESLSISIKNITYFAIPNDVLNNLSDSDKVKLGLKNNS